MEVCIEIYIYVSIAPTFICITIYIYKYIVIHINIGAIDTYMYISIHTSIVNLSQNVNNTKKTFFIVGTEYKFSWLLVTGFALTVDLY